MWNIKNKIKKRAQSFLGITSIQNQLSTLQYLFNEELDITKAKTATGSLRVLQECDSILLKIFHTICCRKGWTYWLDWGTLLGAYRHNGFIPWDDDLDVGMLRKDYEEAVSVLPQLLSEIDSGFECHINPGSNCLGIGFLHSNTGIWMDVYPYDMAHVSSPKENLSSYNQIVREIKHNNYKARGITGTPFNQCKDVPWEKTKDCNIVFSSPISFDNSPVYLIESVFPLKLFSFESSEFYVPADIERVLTQLYGMDFMKFPRSGILHHGEGRLPLQEWADFSGTNMNIVKADLLKIYENIQ